MKDLKIQALRFARDRIEKEHNVFICAALGDWADEASEEKIAEGLKKIIAQQIEGAATLTGFLWNKYRFDGSFQEDKLCRLAWIDKMIYDLENAP